MSFDSLYGTCSWVDRLFFEARAAMHLPYIPIGVNTTNPMPPLNEVAECLRMYQRVEREVDVRHLRDSLALHRLGEVPLLGSGQVHLHPHATQVVQVKAGGWGACYGKSLPPG